MQITAISFLFLDLTYKGILQCADSTSCFTHPTLAEGRNFMTTHGQSIGLNNKFQQISSRERIRERYFPNLVLTDQNGRKLKFYDDLVKDKIVIFNMFYAQCQGICTPITRNLVRLQQVLGERVGKDMFMYSFTLKPEEDSPEALKHYAHMHKVKPGWLFLTGSPNDMETLRRKLGFVDPDPEVDKDKSNHIGLIKYGNEPLERWGGCPGMQSPEWIAKTISWLTGPGTWRKPNGILTPDES